MREHFVSVVIAVFNGEKTIRRTLQVLFEQDYLGPPEIIVVDDGSWDHTASIIQSFPRVVYCRQSNQGPAFARNQGVRLARGEIIFFTDADCIPMRDWISTGVLCFNGETAIERQRQFLPPPPAIGAVAGTYGIANEESLLARCIHREINFRHTVLMPSSPKSFGSYNVAVRKDVFVKAGGFDPSYRYPSGEDNDLSYKILSAGYNIYFCKESVVLHYHPARFFLYMKEQYRHGFWRVKIYGRHPHMSLGDDYTFWKDILEPPLALIILTGFLTLKWFSLFKLMTFGGLSLLGSIEVYYGFKISNRSAEALFSSWTMFVRSFFRAAGFSSGIIYFSFLKILKKSK